MHFDIREPSIGTN